jgi:hypothetical protein
MRCRKSQEYISRGIDGDLTERERARLEGHLDSCPDCRRLSEDLGRIVAGAGRLETPKPSDEVWSKIRTELAKDRRAGERIEAVRPPAFWLGAPAFRYAGVAALALVLIVTGVVVGLRLGRGGIPAGPEARERYTLAKLDEAEGYYQKAITSLAEAFASGRGSLPAEVAEIFDRNLSVIDATIQACRRSVVEAPDDLEARNYLMAAYTQKITLLDSALDLQQGDRPAAGKIKTL